LLIFIAFFFFQMIRISVSSICYQRGVFESDCFVSKPYDGLPIHQLNSAKQGDNGQIEVLNGEAFQLTQWLERGVFQVLQKEFLQGMTFALCSKHPVTGEDMLLEKYDFKIAYSGNDKRASINGVPLDSKLDLKNQAKKFLRSLIAFVETLDDLPQNRWITIMLKYCDDMPEEFEPEFFRGCQQNALNFGSVPIKVKLGGLNTQHMGMGVTYTGLESLLYEDLCKVVTSPLDMHNSQDTDEDGQSIIDGGLFQGSKEGTQLSKNLPAPNDSLGEDLLTSKLSSSLTLNTPPTMMSAADTANGIKQEQQRVMKYV
jgi:hypothetical protein